MGPKKGGKGKKGKKGKKGGANADTIDPDEYQYVLQAEIESLKIRL